MIARALEEDLRYGPDVTTLATVRADATTTASMVVRQPGVIAGVDIALLVLDEVLGAGGYRRQAPRRGRRHDWRPAAWCWPSRRPTQGLLTAERTMLNLVCHLSGIATTTAAWVAAVEGTDAKIRDTRKTLPGLRALQKYAVRVGGGVNHRMGLGDATLIKDNHVAAAGSVLAALHAVRAAAPDLPCEVEVDSLEQLDEVLAENLATELWCCSTTSRSGRRRSRCSAAILASPATKLESSGGLSLDTAAEYAGTGVDYLAVGALTHSVTRARHRPGPVAAQLLGEQRARGGLCGIERSTVTRNTRQNQRPFEKREDGERRLVGFRVFPAVITQSVRDGLCQARNARADASRTSGLAFTDSVAIGSMGHPSRRSTASPEDIRSIQPSTMSVTGNPLSRNCRSRVSMPPPALSTTAAASCCLPSGKWWYSDPAFTSAVSKI